jgi:hypothetical protein
MSKSITSLICIKLDYIHLRGMVSNKNRTSEYSFQFIETAHLETCNSIPKDHVSFDKYSSEPQNTRDRCIISAGLMRFGLRVGGKPAFNIRRQQYCQCC